MVRVYSYPEYRLVIPGKAASFRTNSSLEFKMRIRRYAKKVFKSILRGGEMEIRIDYFHCRKRNFDMDNVAKAVIDALSKIAFYDDKQARLQSAEGHWLGGGYVVYNGPLDLIKPLRKYDEYTFIRIRHIIRN